jgi:hypothetical protein
VARVVKGLDLTGQYFIGNAPVNDADVAEGLGDEGVPLGKGPPAHRQRLHPQIQRLIKAPQLHVHMLPGLPTQKQAQRALPALIL